MEVCVMRVCSPCVVLLVQKMLVGYTQKHRHMTYTRHIVRIVGIPSYPSLYPVCTTCVTILCS